MFPAEIWRVFGVRRDCRVGIRVPEEVDRRVSFHELIESLFHEFERLVVLR
jgi:hypothetical protein